MPVSLHLYLAGVRRSYDEEKESYEPLARWARLGQANLGNLLICLAIRERRGERVTMSIFRHLNYQTLTHFAGRISVLSNVMFTRIDVMFCLLPRRVITEGRD